MTDFTSAKWQAAYYEALGEMNLDAIDRAESAIYDRLTEIVNVSDDKEESAALRDALSMLRVLKTKLPERAK
jgi:hypothetical protein